MKKPVPPEIIANIAAQGKAGREAWQRGDTQNAEDRFLDAWRQLPEPKVEYVAVVICVASCANLPRSLA